jgi:radical SAM superfamily enzyme YgiQ (UPF0313 family)
MKVLLIALNASYTHTNLAVRTLALSLRHAGHSVTVYESTVNQPIGELFAGIAAGEWDVAAFSCYIWNIETVRRLTARLHVLYPEKPILWGGPEVSFDTAWWMGENPGVRYILRGEGEQVLPELVSRLESGQDMAGLQGVAYRDGDTVIDQGLAKPVPMDSVPFPYDEGIGEIRDRLLYYESSRGCPFACGYCLSGVSPGVRYRALDTVKEEIAQLSEWGAGIVKFVDRTFNSDRARAAELFSYIAGLSTDTLFHFEICADLLDEMTLDILKAMPPGRAQFEIGVQSATPNVLAASSRKSDLDRLTENVRRLQEMGHIHLHLDLIAGLPGETLESFAASFNRVWGMRTDRLQVGFLKLLRGSQLRDTAAEWGCRYAPDAPYEVLATGSMTYRDLSRVHAIEEMVERYANTGRYTYTLARLVGRAGGDAFSVFDRLGTFIGARYKGDEKPSFEGTYDDLFAFGVEVMGEDAALLRDLIKLDFVSHAKPKKYPACLTRPGRRETANEVHAALNAVGDIDDAPPDERKAHVEHFAYDVLSPDLRRAPDGVRLLFLYQKGKKTRILRLPPHC